MMYASVVLCSEQCILHFLFWSSANIILGGVGVVSEETIFIFEISSDLFFLPTKGGKMGRILLRIALCVMSLFVAITTIGCGLQSECGGDIGPCPTGMVCIQNVGKDAKEQTICVQQAESQSATCPVGQHNGSEVQLVPQPGLEDDQWGCGLPCDKDEDCARGACNQTTYQCLVTAQCQTNADCSNGMTCTNGQCVANNTCTPACGEGQTCVNGTCQAVSGKKCTYASDCESNLCKDGVCATCSSDADCNNAKCSSGKCVVDNPQTCQYHQFTYGGQTYCANGVNSSDLAKLHCFRHTDGKIYLYIDLMAGNIRYDHVSFRDAASTFAQVSGNVIELKSACFYPYALANGQRLPASWTDPYRAASASASMEWAQYGSASYDTSYPNPRGEEWPCCRLLKK